MRQPDRFFSYKQMLKLAKQKGDTIEIVQLTSSPGDRELGIPPSISESATIVEGWSATKEFSRFFLAGHGASMAKYSHTVYIFAEDPNFNPDMITSQTRIRVNGMTFKQIDAGSTIRYLGEPKLYVYNLNETTESEALN